MLLQLSGHFAVLCCPGEGNCQALRAGDRSKCWLLLLWLLSCSTGIKDEGFSALVWSGWFQLPKFTLWDVGPPSLLHVNPRLECFGLTRAQHSWSLWEAQSRFEESLAGTCEMNCFPRGLAEFGWISARTDNQGNSSSCRLYNGQMHIFMRRVGPILILL